jgi:hypothetical protein
MKNFCYKFTPNESIHYIYNAIDFEFDNLDGFVKIYTNNGINLIKQNDLILFGWAEDFGFEV